MSDANFNDTTPSAPAGKVNATWQKDSSGNISAAVNVLAGVVTTGGSPTHAGEVLISQPGNSTATWADPLVQGVFPPGTDVATANGASPPTPLNPVLVGASDPSGDLQNLSVDGSGNLLVSVPGSVAVTMASTTITGTVAVAGTVTANAGTNLNTSLLALEAGGNIAAIKADVDKIPSQGQALAAASMPVVLTAIQQAALTPPAAITGFALETGGNLAAIKADTDKIPSQGQALAAASMPVVLTAAQLATLTPPAVFGGVVTQPTGTNLHVVVDSAPAMTATVTGTVTVAQVVSPPTPWTDNISQWGGTAVQAASTAATDGTGANPIVRNIPRRYSQVLTTTPLAANATYTSAWFDTNQTGAVWVEIGLVSNVASTNPGFSIQQSDDQVNIINTTASSGNLGGTDNLQANTYQADYAAIVRRYWRVKYTNGATLQTTFYLQATEFTTPQFPVLLSGSSYYGSPAFGLAALGTSGLGNVTSSAFSSFQGTQVAPLVSVAGLTSAGSNPTVAGLRTPAVFKTVQATASGNTALWTPTSGTKFRVMKYMVVITGNASLASSGVLTIVFQDATTATAFAIDVYVPATGLAGGADFVSPWIDLGNGFLSATANNVLNVNLSAALTAGNVRVVAIGTEE
jgi:hypothetical protein